MKRIAIPILMIMAIAALSLSADNKKQAEKTVSGLLTSVLSKIEPVAVRPLAISDEYSHGKFIKNGELLTFQTKTGLFKNRLPLSKLIVCNKAGEIQKTYNDVVWWGGQSHILRFNAVKSLLLSDLDNDTHKRIDIDMNYVTDISFDPYVNRIIFMLNGRHLLYCYDIKSDAKKTLAEIGSDHLNNVTQFSANEIIYLTPQTISRANSEYTYDRVILPKIPLIISNIEQNKLKELAQISKSGLLLHYNFENREVMVVVEENGFLKVIKSRSPNSNNSIDITGLSEESADDYSGFLLQYASVNSQENLIASSHLILKKKNSQKLDKQLFYELNPDMFETKSGDIYVFDLSGNKKRLTNNPQQIELVCDWNDKKNEMLYFDYIGKKYYLMEIGFTGKNQSTKKEG